MLQTTLKMNFCIILLLNISCFSSLFFILYHFFMEKGNMLREIKLKNGEIIIKKKKLNQFRTISFDRWMNEWMEYIFMVLLSKTQISIVEEWVLFIFSVNWWKLIFYFVQWNRKRTNFPYVLYNSSQSLYS